MSDITYRPATEADAKPLAAFFAEMFRETFGHLYEPADLAAFLAGHEADAWSGQLRDASIAIRITEQNGAVAGYAKLGPVKLPVELTRPALELHQLYLAPGVRGLGVAAMLMDWLIGEAGARGAEELYLSVYTDNGRARRFYARYGFVEIGPCIFMVGNHADEDIIARATLG